jgi:amidase
VLVEVAPLPQAQSDALSEAETFALQTEFKAAIGAYLAQAAPPAGPRTLQDLIGFNAGAPAETALFGQETFVAAASRPGLDDPAYREQRARARRLAGAEGLDRMFAAGQVEAIVAQTGGPASVIDPVNGAKPMGSVSSLPAVAGYPHLTLPMGAVSGLPVGLSIIGPAWSDARVLAFGYAFEQAAAARLRPGFAASLPLTPVQARALDPP